MAPLRLLSYAFARMRALLWTDYFWPAIGGTEVLALNLVRGFRARGIEVEVVANLADDAAVAPPPDVAVHHLPLRRALSERDVDQIVALRQTLSRLIARVRPALVHVMSLGPGDVFLDIARARAGIPTMVTLHQVVPPALLATTAVIGQTLRRADWITACSHAMRETLLQAVPEAAAHCSIVFHAPHLAPRPLADPPVLPRVLCLGRLVEDKGFDLALRAFAALAPRHPHARLIIAGDGPQRVVLTALAHELGIAERVDILGWVHPDAVGALIDAATLVLIPSRREPGSLVALEAALRGRAVIAARAGGLPELVEHEVGGLLVPVGDVPALTAALARLLGDPHIAIRMGRSAQARAERRYPWEATLDAYHALYLQVAATRRSG